jgi:hypothetical protein
VKDAYVNFLTHCYIDTEVEMKEIYTSNHMWKLFERSFLLDMAVVSNATHDRKHADTALEHYVTHTLMDIITVFFSSPFSDQSTTVQVKLAISDVYLHFDVAKLYFGILSFNISELDRNVPITPGL